MREARIRGCGSPQLRTAFESGLVTTYRAGGRSPSRDSFAAEEAPPVSDRQLLSAREASQGAGFPPALPREVRGQKIRLGRIRRKGRGADKCVGWVATSMSHYSDFRSGS